jgi:hypothetical protein
MLFWLRDEGRMLFGELALLRDLERVTSSSRTSQML